MSIELEGFDGFIAKLDNAIKEIPKKRNDLLKSSAENLIRYTKDFDGDGVKIARPCNSLATIKKFINF